ncbi:hypothetical protein COI07_06820 [Neisseria meningitidis]|nr:hypothetical protein COI07_06820 [Neisseria meningitidis]
MCVFFFDYSANNEDLPQTLLGRLRMLIETDPMLPRKFKNLKFRPNQHTRCPMPIEIPHTNKKVPKIGTKTDNFRHY